MKRQSTDTSLRHDKSLSAMIAGQLIIYDLDEEPPIASQLSRKPGKVIAQLN